MLPWNMYVLVCFYVCVKFLFNNLMIKFLNGSFCKLGEFIWENEAEERELSLTAV